MISLYYTMKSLYLYYIGWLPVLLWANTTLFAQQTTLKGQVYDAQNHHPLSGVYIYTADSSSTAVSDLNGKFTLKSTKEKGLIYFTSMGYDPQKKEFSGNAGDWKIWLVPEEVNLSEIVIQAFHSNRKNKDVPGAIAVLNQQDIRKGSGVSLQPSLNAVPGVQFQQSHLSESRVAIRGNGVRAQYGIRGIKIYLDGIPVTEADGTTRLEAIDVSNLGSAEIIKGPASSIYGSGASGGVINLQMERAPYGQKTVETSGLAGAFGLQRIATAYRSGSEKANAFASYGYQEYDGYRDHSRDLRRFISGNFQFFPSERQTITLLLNRTTQNTQIPGALTKDEVKENRKQASSGNLDKQAARRQTWTRVGLGQNYRFSDRFSNQTSVFTYFYDLDHPLSFAYLRNFYESYGGRTLFTYDPDFHFLETKLMLGGEYNQAKTKGTQYVNNQGKEGDLLSNVDNTYTSYSFFLQSETNLTKKMLFTFGLSYIGLEYAIRDYLEPSETGSKHFDPQLSPRVALSYDFGDALSLHGSVSTGFAPPTGGEISNADGTINKEITAEESVNYELNAKGGFFNARLGYDFSLFRMNMKGELIPQAISQGVTVYHNAGKTRHTGAELAVSYQAIRKDDGSRIFSSLKPYAALTYSHFRFVEFQLREADGQVTGDFAGNKITGIPPWTAFVGIQAETDMGVYAHAHWLFNDKMPLNDANTDFNDAYQTLNLKVGYRKKFRHFGLDLYAGLDNILDRRYSSLTALNAVAYGGGQPAYFNPSPGRNGYVGIHLNYNF